MLAIFAAVLAGLVTISQQRPQPQDATSAPSSAKHDTKAYDYIVVGGGTAGLAIAARLAEGSSNSIAVIEAGGFYEQDNGNFSVIPGFCTVFAGTAPDDFNPLVDWGLVTEPQKVSPQLSEQFMNHIDMNVKGAGNRRLHYPRGKTLGGSSARNFMYYHR